MSGLKMNTEKTRIIWIGRKKGTREKLETNPVLSWGHTAFDLLGINFSNDINNMVKLNYDKYLTEAKMIIKHWNKRYLTPLGKISVIKTFILSKFIHIFTALPTPKDAQIDELNKLIYQFVWNNKPDKIKRIQITQGYENGGLKLTNIPIFIDSLKITWIRRLIVAQNSQWVSLFESTITKKEKLYLWGIDYLTP